MGEGPGAPQLTGSLSLLILASSINPMGARGRRREATSQGFQVARWDKGGASCLWMNFDPRNRELSETGGHLRIVDAAVVEDKAGAGEGHARLLRLELQLDNVVVPCGQSRP